MITDNRAARAFRRYFSTLVARDCDALADTLAESLLVDDRRAGIHAKRDRDAQIKWAAVEIGIDDVRIDVLDTRGEDVVLVRLTATAGETGFVVETLAVARTDADGRLVEAVQLDAEELDAAREALDALAAAEPVSTENRAARAVHRYFDTVLALARDWDGNADMLADSFVIDDCRSGVHVKRDRNAQIEWARTGHEVGIDDVRAYVLDTRAEDVALARITATASESGFVIETLVVARTDADGRLVEAAQLDAEELDAAREALDAIAASS